MPNANQDGFEAKILVTKSDNGYVYRLLLIGSSADFEIEPTTVYRTPLAAFRAGSEALYSEVLGVLTGA